MPAGDVQRECEQGDPESEENGHEPERKDMVVDEERGRKRPRRPSAADGADQRRAAPDEAPSTSTQNTCIATFAVKIFASGTVTRSSARFGRISQAGR